MKSITGVESPLSTFRKSLENATSSPAYKTPVKMMEEDVLVMDGVVVASAPGVRASMSCCSGARKTVICVAWETFGQCRYGSNCQFAHGKEELHPPRFSAKDKSELHASKTYPRGSSSYGPNYPLRPLVLMEAANQKASPTRPPEYPCKSAFFSASPECSSENSTPVATPEPLSRTPSAIIPGSCNKRPATVFRPASSKTPVTYSEYWSPQDDGILVALPAQTEKCSSRKEVDAYIENALYGPTRKKRLPVFTEFAQITDTIC